ncbi:MAG: (cytosine-5)-methyltransferase 1 [Verrucomicrobiota bacterium]|jgi:DNA (cytosine-5)-methyltransferase 1
MIANPRRAVQSARTFIDLYAGCGGLSLGLMHAGWKGVFAVEKEENAFSTLAHNLVNGGKAATTFDWPKWLPKAAISVESLLENYRSQLQLLRGKITLLAGGPPCQGFSTLGRRIETDPRNQAFRAYLELVAILRPKVVLMENVRGITLPFSAAANKKPLAAPVQTYAELISSCFKQLKYNVWTETILSRDFGVPQTRPRFILVAYLGDPGDDTTPFDALRMLQKRFLDQRKLRTPVGAKQALGDLQTAGVSLSPCVDSPGHKQGSSKAPRSSYQKLMHGSLNGVAPNSHRLANHRPETVKKFRWLINNCTKGKILAPDERGVHKTGKRTLYVLSPTAPAPTVTTLPDDMLHFSEPRILTVREMARLQSFPDWFEFQGKYTTGGKLRTKECPRYTQVGNAVPPLLADALGRALVRFLKAANETQ